MGFLLRDFKAGIAVVSRIDPGKGRMTMRVRYERSTSNTRIKTMPNSDRGAIIIEVCYVMPAGLGTKPKLILI